MESKIGGFVHIEHALENSTDPVGYEMTRTIPKRPLGNNSQVDCPLFKSFCGFIISTF